MLKQQYMAFLSMTTHDLLAPLRKLGVLTERLTQKFEGAADEETRQYTSRIHTCIDEMRSIVNGFLQIAEAIPENMEKERIDTSEITDQVLQEKSNEIKERKASILAKGLPELEGDRKQIGTLFKEIIENALVFSKKDLPLKLEISAAELSPEEKESMGMKGKVYWKFIFKDNGIGFKNEEAELIFEPTVRLHGKSGYPGNGLGLTLVKKIVANHRGCVFAESGEDGSRFIVILPKN